MAPAKRVYEPGIFEGRVMLPEEQEQIHEEISKFERMEYVSPPMRELIMARRCRPTGRVVAAIPCYPPDRGLVADSEN